MNVDGTSEESVKCRTLSCSVTGWQEEEYGAKPCLEYVPESLLGCFCLQELTSALAKSNYNPFEATTAIEEQYGELCKPFAAGLKILRQM